MKVAVVAGNGGIGGALVRRLAGGDGATSIVATYRRGEPPTDPAGVTWHRVDLTDEASIRSWSATLGEVDWLINAAGLLHAPEGRPEKSILQVEADFFLRNVSINALSTLLLAKHTQHKFRHGRPGVFAAISARVGSIGDNRLGGWYSYRASKAALNMCIKTLALEWKRTLPNVAVAALHPGTTDTALSRPYQRNVPDHKLFSPDHSAARMLDVLGALTPAKTGGFWAYDAKPLPW